MTSIPRAARIAVLGAWLVIGCGEDDHPSNPATPTDTGVSAQFVSPAMGVVSFTHAVVTITASVWNEQQPFDASWHYDAGLTQWARADSGYSSESVSSPGGPTTEVRRWSVVDMRVEFRKAGVPQADYLTADQARMQLRVRQFTSTEGGPYVPPETYDITTRTSGQFGLTAGSADTIVMLGNVLGWWEHALVIGRQKFDYGGTIQIDLNYPDHFVICPDERMTADIYLFEDGVEVDRYTGSFSAAQDQEIYTGAIESERGPGRYVINRNRGCPTGTTPALALSTRAR